MAKATVICTCTECGAKFEKSTIKQNRREADSWESWAVSNYTQCPSCWAKEQRQKQVETPLTLIIDVEPFSQKIILHFDGNTMPAKDDIKTLGYSWGDKPMTGFLGILETRSKKCWYKITDINSLDNEINQVKNINAIITNHITAVDLAALAEIAKKQDAKQAEITKIQKPIVPAKLAGKKWNGTIYGKAGSYCFYGDGQKIELTDTEKTEIEAYLKAKAEYKKAVAEIENKF